jgi:hypothetical protein
VLYFNLILLFFLNILFSTKVRIECYICIISHTLYSFLFFALLWFVFPCFSSPFSLCTCWASSLPLSYIPSIPPIFFNCYSVIPSSQQSQWSCGIYLMAARGSLYFWTVHQEIYSIKTKLFMEGKRITYISSLVSIYSENITLYGKFSSNLRTSLGQLFLVFVGPSFLLLVQFLQKYQSFHKYRFLCWSFVLHQPSVGCICSCWTPFAIFLLEVFFRQAHYFFLCSSLARPQSRFLLSMLTKAQMDWNTWPHFSLTQPLIWQWKVYPIVCNFRCQVGN